VLPSNEGRGYVIRRILRRAVVRALDLGIEDAFLFRVVGSVIDLMRHAYPELDENREKIALIVKSDEERFQRTLLRGMAIFNATVHELAGSGHGTISGEAVFKLYDTYGFPIEITQELAQGHGLQIDLEGFEAEMTRQRERARQASKLGRETEGAEEISKAPENFVGYDNLEVPTVISSIAVDSEHADSIREGEEARVDLERTPFYPEGGGQLGDVGVIVGNEGRATVLDVTWGGGSRISHRARVDTGSLSVGEGVVAHVDVARRKATQRNHTATHLLHSALRSVLGGHVRQSGSLVAPDRLRFDFTHYEPVCGDEILRVEDIVNMKILDDLPVRSSVEPFENAKAKGAIALFGEKYGQEVRVIEIEGTSCELCGGTHVGSTGEIGGFRIVSETGIAAGIRRVEAVTGHAFVELSREATHGLEELSSILKVPVRDLEDGARKTMERIKELEKEVTGLRQRLAGAEIDEIIKGAKAIGGIKVVAARVDAPNIELLKHMADRLRERLADGVVCLASGAGDRVFIVVSVAPSVVSDKGLKASAIAKKMGELVGGKGGGKDTFAQAGGKSADLLDVALGRCEGVIASLVSK
jgi:alanyl-tRNA synthetase